MQTMRDVSAVCLVLLLAAGPSNAGNCVRKTGTFGAKNAFNPAVGSLDPDVTACECMDFYLCPENKVRGLFVFRTVTESDCEDSLQVCCLKETQIPPTQIPPTQMPPTQIPPTQMPPTQMPPTQIPPTQIPPTQMPPTQMPPTQVPPTQVPPTHVPSTQIPSTQMPSSQMTSTQMPSTQMPSTQMPSTQMLSTLMTSTQMTSTQMTPAQMTSTQMTPAQMTSTQKMTSTQMPPTQITTNNNGIAQTTTLLFTTTPLTYTSTAPPYTSTAPPYTATPPPSLPSPPPYPPTPRLGCGQRNKGGVAFHMTGNVDGEAQFGEFPWMVALLEVKKGVEKFIGGGSLIHPRVVLTAAHSVRMFKFDSSNLQVRAGEWNTQSVLEIIKHQQLEVEEVIVHENYSSGAIRNDIALLVLREEVERADNVGMICLPAQGATARSSQCIATGWGKDSFGNSDCYQVILKSILLPIVPRRRCQSLLWRAGLSRTFRLHSSATCAGGEDGMDTCEGDGGGPLACPIPGDEEFYEQGGIVSWGVGCGHSGVPAVYTDVSQFRDWVDTKFSELFLDTESYRRPNT